VIQTAVSHPQTFAAIDLGSNSFHMIVCRLNDGDFHIEDRLRETVRLGAGLDEARSLTPQAQESALACLARFGQRLRDMPNGAVRAVGTNTLRLAKNSAEFLARAEQALGHPIEVISGVEEARLIYLGVAHSTGADEQRRFVMDIGGGSTELIIGEGFKPRYMQSLYMGCVTMTQKYFGDGKITPKSVKRAELAARLELEPVEAIYRQLGWGKAIGASGSIRAVRDVARASGWSDEDITLDSLKQIRDAMLAAGSIDKLQFKGLSAERTQVFPGGAMILLATFKALGIERMQVSDGALREGLIHELLGRVQHEDVRKRAVANLARRYHVDLTQAKRVAKTAVACAAQVAPAWELDLNETRQWLEWGAKLHEIGLDIAHNQYHKHGAYIAEHADIEGFSRQEQLVLACLVLNHRRKFNTASFKRLAEHRAEDTQTLAVILRLAVLLHRSRSPAPLPPIQLTAAELSANKKSLTITFPPGWLEDHRLTHADLEQEAAFLKAADFMLEFS
jgi:exopolyphosphatase/guanosine-5'-triphosphate,3'-diphosphate pyrophosphatase